MTMKDADYYRALADQYGIPRGVSVPQIIERYGDLMHENRRLREWIDTVGRECPSYTTIDAFLATASAEDQA
jgi:hypothetical protein